MNEHLPGATKAGIAGGILCSLAVNISRSDLLRTIILATVGAVVSVLVSMLVKYCFRKRR